MFEELCLYPRVDSGVFSSVARRYGVFSLPIGPAPGTSRLDPEGSTLFDALGPLYAAALRSISGKLAELDQLGLGRGIERQWNILGVSPDQLLYNIFLKLYGVLCCALSCIYSL